MRPHVFFNSGVLNNGAFRSDISFQNGNGTFFFYMIFRKQDVIHGKFIVCQISCISLEKVILFHKLQIFSQRQARAGQNVQIQIFFHSQLDSGNSACKPHAFCGILAAGQDICNVGDFVVDLIEQFHRQINSEFPSKIRNMNHGICGAAYRAMDNNGIYKGFLSDDLAECNSFFHQIHHRSSSVSGKSIDVTHCGRRERGTGECNSHGFRQALHGAGGSVHLTCADRRASG